MKYAMFKGPLLCEKQKNGSYWVINGEWNFTPGKPFKEGIAPIKPKKLWEGDELPYPRRDYDENIDAIEHFIETGYYNRDGN